MRLRSTLPFTFVSHIRICDRVLMYSWLCSTSSVHLHGSQNVYAGTFIYISQSWLRSSWSLRRIHDGTIYVSGTFRDIVTRHVNNNLVSCSSVTVRPLPSKACNAIVSTKVKARLVTLSCYHSVNSEQEPSALVKTPYHFSRKPLHGVHTIT